ADAVAATTLEAVERLGRLAQWTRLRGLRVRPGGWAHGAVRRQYRRDGVGRHVGARPAARRRKPCPRRAGVGTITRHPLDGPEPRRPLLVGGLHADAHGAGPRRRVRRDGTPLGT